MTTLAALVLCLPAVLLPAPQARAESFDLATIELTLAGIPANGTSWTEGENVPLDITVTNTSAQTLGYRPTDANLSGHEACRWHWMAPNSPQVCSGRAHYTVTAADVAAGTLRPSVTYSAFSARNYGGEETLVGTVTTELPVVFNDDPGNDDDPGLTATIETLTPAPADGVYRLGQVIDYRLLVTNGSANARSAFVSASNLDGTSSCRWRNIAANNTVECLFSSHTISAEDIAAGSFTPSVTWSATSQPGYNGDVSVMAPVEGDRLTTGGPTTFDAAAPTSSSDANPGLEPGVSEPVTLGAERPGAYNIRIPAIAVAPNGDLLASYDRRPLDGGARGGDSPNANWIVQRRSTDNGATWEPETVIAQGDTTAATRLGFSDPSYVVDATTGTIFNFHVQSYDSGVFANNPAYTRGPDGRIDETDRRTMNLGLSVSTDNGRTWAQRVVTAQALHDKTDLRSCFATSGAGIQKKQEPHAGRLVQQIACVRTNGEIVAMSMYSDDHGQTWATGAYVPTSRGDGQTPWRFDENKVVELSDGRLMLNSRTPKSSPGGGHRIVAVSEDGGLTWGEPYTETQLLDSGNNAQVIRAYPDAAPGSARSRVLLYSGAFNQERRTNGTVLASCDDGQTWSSSRELLPGGTGYTTMAVLPDGSIGMLYEPRVWNDIAYIRFTLSDIAPNLCEPEALQVGAIENQTLTDGEALAPVRVTAAGGDEALERTVTVTGLPGGLAYDAASGTITGTASAGVTEQTDHEVTVTVTEAEDGTGLAPRTASTTFTLTLTPGSSAPPSAAPSATASASGADAAPPTTSPGATGKPLADGRGLARTGAATTVLLATAGALAAAGLLLRRRATRC